jgi:hypothetical protein
MKLEHTAFRSPPVSQSQSHVTTDGQSVGLFWSRAPSGARGTKFISWQSLLGSEVAKGVQDTYSLHFYTAIIASPWRRDCCLVKTLIYLLTYGAEPFLRSCQLCSYSRTAHLQLMLRSRKCGFIHTLPCTQATLCINVINLKLREM